MADTSEFTNNIIRQKPLARQLGVSDTTLWRMRDDLPKPVQISKGIKGWRQSDIDRWLEARRAAQ